MGMWLIIFMIFILPPLAFSFTIFILLHKGSQKKILRNIASAIILGVINNVYQLLINNLFIKQFGHSLTTNDNLKLGLYITVLSIMHIPINWTVLKLFYKVFDYEISNSLKVTV